MVAAVEWFKKQLGMAETRGAGRVVPDMLYGIKISLPGSSQPITLNMVATVGVREGSTLVVTVFEEAVSFSVSFLGLLMARDTDTELLNCRT